MAALTLLSIYGLRFTYSLADVRGRALGIIGVLLLLQTELTYTWRKKRHQKAVSHRKWLQMHVLTGILGPALIVWHSGFVFSGFAGFVTGLMILVTISGVFGRYFYRAFPRALPGEEYWHKLHQPLSTTLFFAIGLHVAMVIYYARSF